MSGARTHLRFWVPALVALIVLVFAATAQADYEQVGLFAKEGNGEQLSGSEGIAVNTTGAGGVEAGSVYVSGTERVSRYSPTGEIKEVWGYGTIKSGPDLPNAVQSITLKAAAGAYTLTASTGTGRGNFTEGSNVVTGVTTSFGAFHVGDAVRAPENIASGATITAVGAGTLELSAAATKGSNNGFIGATETTAPIQATASAAEVKQAVVALEGFAESDLSVTGGPGDAEGQSPYEVSFEGAWGGSRSFPELSATNVSLSGGNPSSSVAVTTLVDPNTPRYERCRPENGDVCAPQNTGNGSFHQEAVGYFNGPIGIAVDQSTGYVYVLNRSALQEHHREHNLIEVFSADGSESIARFGDAATSGETIEGSPERLEHKQSLKVGVAVNDGGNVYLTDNNGSGAARVMCFRPETPGDYHHYVYCGRSQDVNLTITSRYYERLALDDAGHVYVATQSQISEFSLAEPAAPALCTYSTNGQAYSMTTNPVTGEVFYFNGSQSDKKLHRLKPCDPEAGHFEEAQAPVNASPPTQRLGALAFNPTFTWGAERPDGVLYGASEESIKAEGAEYHGLGYIFAPAEVHPPAVLSESVSGTRTTSTILRAEIDPHGYGTRYVFQYLTEAQYEANEAGERFAGAMEAPAGGGEIGAGEIGQALVAVTGLTPDTAYRFRVVATSECEAGEPCVTDGEAASFATYPLFPPGLPDHRAYELVSPVQKHGGEVLPAEPEIASCKNCKPNASGVTFPMQSSPDGEALAYEGQPFNPFEGAINYDSYVSRRTGAGWQSTALIPALPPTGVKQLAFDTSLGEGLLSVEASSSDRAKLEVQSTSNPNSTVPLVTETNHRSATDFKLTYGGHSADFTRQFFAANDSLTEETPFAPEPPDPGAAKNDLYEWHAGQLTLVNVLPGNATVAAGAKFASVNPDTHAVSEDGSMVFFEDEAGNLYVREGGEATRQINDPGHFLSASPNGDEVLLTDGCLYAVEAGTCADLTEGHGGFQGLVGQSTDLSHLYFVDTAVLGDEEANEAGEVAEAGKNNLYSSSGGEAQFVAILLEGDSHVSSGNKGLADWVPNPSQRSAEASPDGRFLAFGSTASLTGYDNVGPCGTGLWNEELLEYAVIPAPCMEVFLYDSATGRLLCASCNPTGEAPLGNATLRRIFGAPERLPQPRYLTDEGRLYFDSQDSLVARDTNEGVEDVYEYSPQGTGAEGTCEREAGCTRLISAGTEAVDSNLIAVDETGKNVFFDTRDRLALKDKDELLDIYDAREGGGIGAESEIARGECQGEACQAPVYPPNDPTPASSSFEGAGNVKEEPAAKKHKKHAKKKHKRHSKKHSKKHRKAKKHARTAKRNHGGAK